MTTTTGDSREPPCIRLVFQLERAELPRLYDELVRFHKGVKRVSRLRMLAYEGLLAQYGAPALIGQSSQERVTGGYSDPEGVTNGLFAPAVDNWRGS